MPRKVEVTEAGFKVKTLPKQETLEEKIARLENQLQADNLTAFKVLATIYEELLKLKGED